MLFLFNFFIILFYIQILLVPYKSVSPIEHIDSIIMFKKHYLSYIDFYIRNNSILIYYNNNIDYTCKI